MQDLLGQQRHKVGRIRFFRTLLSADVGSDPPDGRCQRVITSPCDPLDNPFCLHRIDLRAKVFGGVVFEVGIDFAETAVCQRWNGTKAAGVGRLPKSFGAVFLLGPETPLKYRGGSPEEESGRSGGVANSFGRLTALYHQSKDPGFPLRYWIRTSKVVQPRMAPS